MEINKDTMTAINDTAPFVPVHPGSILGEELKARGISQKVFAEKIGIQATHLSALIHGARNITPAVASKIESGLEGIPAEMWMRLQNSYNIDIQRKKVKPSLLVSGYTPREAPAASLAENPVVYGNRLHVRVSLPEKDKDLLSALASRLGWDIE